MAVMSALKQVASALDGREIGHEVTPEIREMAKAAGVVIVYGASDDLIEFDGAIYDEAGCYSALDDATQYFVSSEGLMRRGRFDAVNVAPGVDAAKITAHWDRYGYSWTYTTDIPHETFRIMEDGEPYCRGIVFLLADAGRS